MMVARALGRAHYVNQKPERDSKQDFIPPPTGDRESRWGFQRKTVWDWLELLIVPLMLALITVAFTWQQNNHQNDLEAQRTEAEQELAKQRAQDEALQAYLGQMGTLMLGKDLRNSKEDSEVRTLARARTLTVLRRLDTRRRNEVVQFLLEAQLVQRVGQSAPAIELDRANLRGVDLSIAVLSGVDLSGIDLSDADLSNADLGSVDLSAAYLSGVDLSNADLNSTDLSDTFMSEADLSNAKVLGADLHHSSLIGADLGGADLFDANLSEASLFHADLRNASLLRANLSGADLSRANLNNANGGTKQQLDQAKSLEGATMPNGQKYEDWIKDKEARVEDGKNGSSS
jgi:uncharacterized protein YjbI with pentapeptide repeats